MPGTNKTLIALSKRAYFLLANRRYREAEKAFLDAYALDNTNAFILVGLGDVSRKLKKFEEAIQYYNRILAIEPGNLFALRGMGNAYRGIQSPENSIPYWQRYLQINPDDCHVMVRLADSLRKVGDMEGARRLYERALELGGNDKFACIGLAHLHYKTGDDAKALAYLRRSLDFDKENVAILTMLGNVHQRRKEFDRGAECFRRALEIDADNVFALYGLGNSLRGLHRLKEAIVAWEKVLLQEPHNQTLYTRVADALAVEGDAARAETYYRRCLAIGFDQYAWLGLAHLAYEAGRYAEAEDCCHQILRHVPGSSRALKLLSRIYDVRGESSKADEIRQQLATHSR